MIPAPGYTCLVWGSTLNKYLLEFETADQPGFEPGSRDQNQLRSHCGSIDVFVCYFSGVQWVGGNYRQACQGCSEGNSTQTDATKASTSAILCQQLNHSLQLHVKFVSYFSFNVTTTYWTLLPLSLNPSFFPSFLSCFLPSVRPKNRYLNFITFHLARLKKTWGNICESFFQLLDSSGI